MMPEINSPVVKFVLFQMTILLPFFLGMGLRHWKPAGKEVAEQVLKVNLTTFEPLVIIWTIWGLFLRKEHIYLPIAGFLTVVAGFVVGVVIVSFFQREKIFKSTFIISSSLANHGFTMGGFLCYLFGGEEWLGMSAIYIIYFIPYTFLFIFNYARLQTGGDSRNPRGIMSYMLNYKNMPVVAILVAFVLHAINIERPDIYFPINIFLLVSIALYYFALGISFNVKSITSDLWVQAVMVIIRFFIIPLVVYVALYFIPLSHDVKSVILLQSFMPAAVYSVVVSILFKLNSELASNIFVVNTLVFLVVILPLLFLLKEGLFL